jgi:hypothetical protein
LLLFTWPVRAASSGVATGNNGFAKLISISLCEKSPRSISTTFAISLLKYLQNPIGFTHQLEG